MLHTMQTSGQKEIRKAVEAATDKELELEMMLRG